MEMIWNLMPNEKLNTDFILSRLSEADICLLTGDKGNLVSFPVDLNTNNMLPTNMTCLSKSITDEIEYAYKYSVALVCETTIVFNTPDCFVEYNKQLLNGFADQIEAIAKPNQHNFVEVYEFLMSRHVKGIYEIKFEDGTSMDWSSLQRYWFGKLEKMKNKKWKIITPDSFN